MTFGKKIFVAALLMVAGGCAQDQAAEPTDQALGPGKVATVNGKVIPESVFRLYAMSTLRKNADDLTAEERQRMVDDLVGIELVAGEAEKQGLLKERTVAAQLELQRLQLLARSMISRYLEQHPTTDAELKAVYDENLPRLAGKQYKARHILVPTKEEADAVIVQLRGGKDFAALAKEHASGPTGPNGGDLGWFTADSMVEQVATAVKGLKVGAYTPEPVKSDYGYHVILLDDTRVQDAPAMDSIREDLQNVVDRNKLQAYMKTLKDAAKVTAE